MNKKPSKLSFLTIIGLFTFVVMALGVLAVVIFLRRPMAAPISVKTEATPLPTLVSPAEVQATAAPTTAPVGSCGNQGSLTILFLGTDQTGGLWPQGADSVRVVKVDFDHQAITVVSFPRDLWVKTADLAAQNLPETRLGLAYYYKKNLTTAGTDKEKDSAAATLIGQALYDNFSLVPQAYVVMHMENIAEIIDSVGGLDINNPTAFTSERKMDFPAGAQHLNGSQAREFIRSNVSGDTARRQRQNLFIGAVQTKMLTPDMLIKIPGLIEAFDESIVTDLTPKLLTDLTCMFQSVSPDQVKFYDIGADLVSERTTADKVTVLDPKVDAIKAKLSEWLGE